MCDILDWYNLTLVGRRSPKGGVAYGTFNDIDHVSVWDVYSRVVDIYRKKEITRQSLRNGRVISGLDSERILPNSYAGNGVAHRSFVIFILSRIIYTRKIKVLMLLFLLPICLVRLGISLVELATLQLKDCPDDLQ